MPCLAIRESTLLRIYLIILATSASLSVDRIKLSASTGMKPPKPNQTLYQLFRKPNPMKAQPMNSTTSNEPAVNHKFCFTYAIDGGAWVIFRGAREASWLSYSQIEKEMGKGWFEKMRAKQGMFTGCWVEDTK